MSQESEHRPDQQQQKAADEQLRLVRLRAGIGQHDQGEKPGTNRGDTGGQAVHVVEHIERVNQPDHPKNAQPISQPGKIDKQTRPPTEGDDGHGDEKLHAEPYFPTQTA